MAVKKMWFGTREYMQWIDCPQINYEASKTGYEAVNKYVDGGNFIRRSTTAAKQYNFSWNLKSRDTIRPIQDYADGIFGAGPIYFIDPFAMDKNILPQYWASPMQNTIDGPVVIGDTRPSATPTSSNGQGYPVVSATYAVREDDHKPSIYLPIPPDHTLWIGVHGSATGTSSLVAIPALSATVNDDPQELTLLAVTNPTRVTDSFSGVEGVTLTFDGDSGSITLSGIIAQVLPTGATPGAGAFISGQGHSGCDFDSQPVLTQYSAALDKVGVSVDLMEVQAWKQ